MHGPCARCPFPPHPSKQSSPAHSQNTTARPRPPTKTIPPNTPTPTHTHTHTHTHKKGNRRARALRPVPAAHAVLWLLRRRPRPLDRHGVPRGAISWLIVCCNVCVCVCFITPPPPQFFATINKNNAPPPTLLPQGGSLGDLMALTPARRVGEPVVAHAMQGLCRALAYLHGERRMHRDVKVGG